MAVMVDFFRKIVKIAGNLAVKYYGNKAVKGKKMRASGYEQ